MQIFSSFFAFKKEWTILIGFCLVAFGTSFFPPFSTFFISPLIIAVVIGAIFANIATKEAKKLKDSGVIGIATKQILRLGIILYGFRISTDQIVSVGFSGVFLAFSVVFLTFFFTLALGKFLKLDKQDTLLIGAGMSICGAAAVMASASVLNSKGANIAVAVCCVVVFGTFGMFFYPFLAPVFGLDDMRLGLFLGGSLHEVAHVVGAGASINETVQENAVILKMLRVLMLVPFLIMLGIFFKNGDKRNIRQSFPLFALMFLVVVGVNSVVNFPPIALKIIEIFDTFLLCVAMCALGFGIQKSMLASMGIRPFVLSFFSSAWIMGICALYVKYI